MQLANKMTETAQGKNALIVGLGKTGASVARYLRQCGFAVAVTDTRAQPPGIAQLQQEAPDAAQFLGGFSETALENADLLVVSPGVSPAESYLQTARARGLPVIGDIELFARELNTRQTFVATPVLAVTGSNGKSTVAT
ncbi:MAG TPA: UDP-N-acetylmuramoyl-L-alanine--D-glutamate ligase, partial [Gammaproteobacteria bacterium]|nr:UDP-N-acetylmuramoyl-L-alanine--D-glutamate ligase [Gammaproteobacteria bacterium]